MKNLISYEEISKLARPCSTEQEMAEAMIAEAQRVEIKPRLGDALYLKLMEENLTEPYITLLNGGRWESDCRGPQLLTGIKTALAYYALARIVRDGTIQASTYGAVIKDDQYSFEAERAERQRQYRELFSQADNYLAEAIRYITANCASFPEYVSQGRIRSNRTTVKILGK